MRALCENDKDHTCPVPCSVASLWLLQPACDFVHCVHARVMGFAYKQGCDTESQTGFVDKLFHTLENYGVDIPDAVRRNFKNREIPDILYGGGMATADLRLGAVTELELCGRTVRFQWYLFIVLMRVYALLTFTMIRLIWLLQPTNRHTSFRTCDY